MIKTRQKIETGLKYLDTEYQFNHYFDYPSNLLTNEITLNNTAGFKDKNTHRKHIKKVSKEIGCNNEMDIT